MTFEEAKKEIKDREHAYWRGFKGLDEEHWHDQRYNPYYEGMSDGLEEASEILDKVEPSGNPEQLTLEELARELRKIFKFRYLTYDRRGDDWYVINLWISKPVYQSEVWWPKKHDEWLRQVSLDRQALRPEIELDLSEYPDINGLTDYSKCIVEVE